jgi:hypothetical protein
MAACRRCSSKPGQAREASSLLLMSLGGSGGGGGGTGDADDLLPSVQSSAQSSAQSSVQPLVARALLAELFEASQRALKLRASASSAEASAAPLERLADQAKLKLEKSITSVDMQVARCKLGLTGASEELERRQGLLKAAEEVFEKARQKAQEPTSRARTMARMAEEAANACMELEPPLPPSTTTTVSLGSGGFGGGGSSDGGSWSSSSSPYSLPDHRCRTSTRTTRRRRRYGNDTAWAARWSRVEVLASKAGLLTRLEKEASLEGVALKQIFERCFDKAFFSHPLVVEAAFSFSDGGEDGMEGLGTTGAAALFSPGLVREASAMATSELLQEHCRAAMQEWQVPMVRDALVCCAEGTLFDLKATLLARAKKLINKQIRRSSLKEERKAQLLEQLSSKGDPTPFSFLPPFVLRLLRLSDLLPHKDSSPWPLIVAWCRHHSLRLDPSSSFILSGGGDGIRAGGGAAVAAASAAMEESGASKYERPIISPERALVEGYLSSVQEGNPGVESDRAIGGIRGRDDGGKAEGRILSTGGCGGGGSVTSLDACVVRAFMEGLEELSGDVAPVELVALIYGNKTATITTTGSSNSNGGSLSNHSSGGGEAPVSKKEGLKPFVPSSTQLEAVTQAWAL